MTSKQNLNWDEVKKPFTYEFSLEPNKTFAFHEDVAPNYENTLAKHTNAHFNAQDGFKTEKAAVKYAKRVIDKIKDAKEEVN